MSRDELRLFADSYAAEVADRFEVLAADLVDDGWPCADYDIGAAIEYAAQIRDDRAARPWADTDA